VSPGRVDLGRSRFEAERVADGIVLEIRPADRFGNLLGPGHAHQVVVQAKGAELKGNFIDRLDGSYAQRIVFTKTKDPKIALTIGPRAKRPMFEVPLSYLIGRGREFEATPALQVSAPRVNQGKSME